MAGSLTDKFGYPIDEVDQHAREVLTVLDDLEAPIELMLLSLCRAITMVATDEELDTACILIDELRDNDELDYELEEGEEDDEQA